MFGVQLTDYDTRVFSEQLAEFLPDKMTDVHVHLWKDGMLRDSMHQKGCVSWPRLVASDCTIEDLMHSYGQMFPGKAVKPVLMTTPIARLEEGNAYALSCARQYGLPVLYCTSYDTPIDELRRAMETDGFCGIKPYQNNSPNYIPAGEVRIFDFLTPEHLELMDELGGIVMLHIPRSKRLRDGLNLAQMLQIEERYPKVKLIIAHIGRAYSPEDIGDAFEVLKATKNMMFDFCANTLDIAMMECIKAVGAGRLMFGSDMPITKMRMYRVSENGRYVNVVPRGMYGDVSGDPNMRETDKPDITTFMYEELLAFKRCAQALKLTRAEIDDILCHNAARLFGMSI